jgi:protease-4
MPLSADTMLDRIQLKRTITRWRLLAVVFSVLATIAYIGDIVPHSKLSKAHIARLTFDDVINDDRDVYDMIDEVADDNSVKAVVVWLDTPGGSAVAGEEIYLRLKALAARKPVVAVMRSVAASAGYMIACGADRIFAREGTITGSIGVIIEGAEFTELAQRIGVKPIIVKSNSLKSTLSPLEKATPESLAVVQKMINDMHGRFIDMVAESRKLPRNEVVTLADGRVYSGKNALELKLIDAIGGEGDAIKWLENNKKIPKNLEISDHELRPPLSFLERAGQSMFGKFFQNSRIKLDGLSAIWHPELS